ncbi:MULTISPECIES: endoglucanase [Methanobrevibacter]|uniref:endoglucanase n=1 Tax=Methanobrevibacter TaxID=2172 RepID=UPI0026F10E2D|nr:MULTISPECIES: endoglucanase [Methanobrevibacter]MDY3096907.1 endoglucanase [Methanobrevibacter sp.]
MPNDRDKLLKIMDSLEADYRSGRISPEKYSYFRSKYEDKLNAIDAREATRRIRSMQGKSNPKTTQKKKSKKPTKTKKEKEEDLVQKYIVNPKKGDARYNKKGKKSMSSGTFKLVLLLVLVVGFTLGVGYGVFNFDFNNFSDTTAVAIVQDSAFPEVVENVSNTTTTSYSNETTTSYSNSSYEPVETTTDYSSSSGDYSGGGSDSGSGSGSSSGDDSGSSGDSGQGGDDFGGNE